MHKRLSLNLLAFASLLLACLHAAPTAAQAPAPTVAPPPLAAPTEPQTYVAPPEGAPVVAPPPAPSLPPSAAPMRDPAAPVALTRELLYLEERTRELQIERSQVRTTGVRVGRAISWGAAGFLLTAALLASGSAEQAKEAYEEGKTDDAYDTNDDGVVDGDDERHSRRVARGLLAASIVPIGLGIFTSILYRRRIRRLRELGAEIDQLGERRRLAVQRLGFELGVSPGQAALDLKLRF